MGKKVKIEEFQATSSEVLSATKKIAGVAAGLASNVRHGRISITATELVKNVSSQAISAAQGVVTKLKHGGVNSSLKRYFNVDGDSWKFQRKTASLELGGVSVRAHALDIVKSEIQSRLLPLLSSVAGKQQVLNSPSGWTLVAWNYPYRDFLTWNWCGKWSHENIEDLHNELAWPQPWRLPPYLLVSLH
ncbi:hypothetical protein F3Y22_tig00111387pilonHSYRG00018 [Hibiscus syriacus]|uniref:Uncharacterized protein n=1 Tax=Hibiscus syriacus TaxID=106335 RepID=A0A6A2YMN0_HIBSY|nr:hypothetical protein F3Y22_tig00111387pilonHSYRG00018 [Hibiscus syriacus]